MSEEELRREKLENEFTGAPAKTRPEPVFVVPLPAKVHSSGFWQVS